MSRVLLPRLTDGEHAGGGVARPAAKTCPVPFCTLRCHPHSMFNVRLKPGEVGVVLVGARPAAPGEGAADPEPAGAAPARRPAQRGALGRRVAHAVRARARCASVVRKLGTVIKIN